MKSPSTENLKHPVISLSIVLVLLTLRLIPSSPSAECFLLYCPSDVHYDTCPTRAFNQVGFTGSDHRGSTCT